MNDKVKWMSTGYLKAAPSGKVDHEPGKIEGVKICTEGDAKGHGVSLDAEFVDTVVRMGNERKQGLKARFGHPNMCSTALGTFLGRHKNFRKETTVRDDGSEAVTALADLFLSNSAKETPNGDLYEYVLNLAENDPDMFGTSIVFTPGREYRKTTKGKKVYHQWRTDDHGERLRNSNGEAIFMWVDEQGHEVDPSKEEIIDRDYVECEALHACDCVDDPAANDGLFSKFSHETVAGQITEFFDLNPEVWDAIQTNPSIVESLARYGDRVDEFINRYREYRGKNKGDDTMSVATYNSEQLDDEQKPEAGAETPEEKKPDTVPETGGKPAETEPPADSEKPDGEKPPEQSEASATAERDALKANLDKAQTESAEFKGRAETAEAKFAAAEKEIAALTKRAVDAETKLAAMEKGAPPLSSTPAPKESEMTPWQKAVAKGRSKK
jgi:hypothetical protein